MKRYRTIRRNVAHATRPRIGVMGALAAAVPVIFGSGAPAFAQCEVARLVGSETSENTEFGIGVSLDGDWLLVGAGANGQGDEAAYVYRFDRTNWNEEAILTASDGEQGDAFGSVSVSGNLAVIGAYLDDDQGIGAGSAYVFRYDGTNWVEQVKLTASDAEPDAWFGIIISVIDDVALIAAPRDDGGGANAGAAYVFRFDGTQWIEEAKLVPDDAEPDVGFGYPVNLSRCGTVAVIGAYNDDDAGLNAGAAYVFRYDGRSWKEETKLVPADAEAGDGFGLACCIDGNVILAGSGWDDDGGENAGAVYVYRNDGTQWIEEAKLVAPDADPGDWFGGDVTISGDVAAISAVNDDGAGESHGAVYVFRFDGSVWGFESKYYASDAAEGDWFGNAVWMDGDHLAIGGRLNDDRGTDSGSAYVFAGLLGVDYDGNGIADLCEALCPADTDGDGYVDFGDLLEILTDWGPCPS